ncbi:hypothetical protein AaE_014096 [Aphanomyces astaci]|uniref:ATP-dependent DNA helicase n=1 Tax=Aphanomyces astaci TaxID=112090 RepID=A0A6A4Z8F6_APHAT|nr:hypothetical protein AaE_014096 [Aphanomyces astaci]
MIHKHALEAVDRSLHDIMDNPTSLFDGKVVIFSGDFKKILPIIPRDTPSATVAASFRRSSIWNDVKIVKLTKNMRLRRGSDDASIEEWAKTLVDIGNETYPDQDIYGFPMIRLPDAIAMNWETDQDLNAYIDQIYVDINNPANPRSTCLSERFWHARTSGSMNTTPKCCAR